MNTIARRAGIAALVCFGLTPHGLATVRLAPVALAGHELPGVEGAAYLNSFGSPVINEHGKLAFLGYFGPDRDPNSSPTAAALLAANGEALTGDDLIATSRAESPLGLPERTWIREFIAPVLNNSGDVAFKARLWSDSDDPQHEVTFHNDEAVFGPIAGSASPLGMIAREGGPAPGNPTATVTGSSYPALLSPALNDAGDVAFHALQSDESGGWSSVIFGPTRGARSPIGSFLASKSGASLPDRMTHLIDARWTRSVHLTANGDMVFASTYRQDGAPRPNNGFFVTDGDLQDPARMIPLPDGVDLDDPNGRFGRSMPYAVNENGDVAFLMLRSMPNPDTGDPSSRFEIYGPTAGTGSPLGLIAGFGQPVIGVPATDAVYEGVVGIPAINASGDVAFMASIRHGAGADAPTQVGLFGPVAGPGSELGLIVGAGDPLPDRPSLVFRGAWMHIDLNDAGGMAFIGTVERPDGSSDQGLFAYDQGVLHTVLLAGDEVELTGPGSGDSQTQIVRGIGLASHRTRRSRGGRPVVRRGLQRSTPRAQQQRPVGVRAGLQRWRLGRIPGRPTRGSRARDGAGGSDRRGRRGRRGRTRPAPRGRRRLNRSGFDLARRVATVLEINPRSAARPASCSDGACDAKRCAATESLSASSRRFTPRGERGE